MNEPVTTITDYILTVETLFLGVLLFRNLHAQESIRLWGAAFFTTAIAALTGGTFHGFGAQLPGFTGTALWKITVYSIGLSSLLIPSGTVFATVSPPLRPWFLAVVIVKFLAYAVWMIGHDDFRYVVYDYAPAMLFVLILHGMAAFKGIGRGSGWIVGGVLVSFAAAGIQQSGFSLHQHFNYNDIYHVIQMGAMYILYRGVLLLRDRQESKI